MDRKWLNLAKAIYSGLHNIPFISTPPPCSNCHHLIYMKLDKMPPVGLSPLLSFSLTLLGVGNTCSRHGSTTEKPAFSFPCGLLFPAIQITSHVYWKRPSLSKSNFLKQLVGWLGGFYYFFFLQTYCPFSNCSTWISQDLCHGSRPPKPLLPMDTHTILQKGSTSCICNYLFLAAKQEQYGKMRCEDKAVLSLKTAMEFIFNITKQRKHIQAASPALWQRLPCMHLNTARSPAPFTCCKTPDSFWDQVSALNANSPLLLWDDFSMMLL